MPEEKSEDKRKSKRYHVRGCTLRYKEDKFLNILGDSYAKFKYVVLDVSKTGLQFISRRKFKKNAKLLLTINAPSLQGEPVSIKGKVMWAREAPGQKVYGVGIQFEGMDEEENEKLQMIVNEAEGKQKKITDQVHIDKAKQI